MLAEYFKIQKYFKTGVEIACWHGNTRHKKKLYISYFSLPLFKFKLYLNFVLNPFLHLSKFLL